MKEVLSVDVVRYMHLLETLNVWQLKAAVSSTLAQALRILRVIF